MEDSKLKSKGAVLDLEGIGGFEVPSGSKNAVGLLILPLFVCSRKGCGF